MKIRQNRIFGIAAIMLTIILLASCSTKKNKWNRRFWHNMTSHYNVWWNGNQSLKNGEKTLRETVKDDYTKTLPVFNYGTKQDALGLNASMDRTIEKDAICIQRHSMRFNNKEYVRWIDDAFIDMGKAQFYKQDYVPARRIFDYVSTQYRTSPDRYTATLWLAKTYIASKQYEKAEALLQSILVAIDSETERVPSYVRSNIDLVYADYYIAIGNEDAAVKYLRSALLSAKGKYNRTRAMFILGQIYEHQNDKTRATEQFKNVIRRHPSYEMTFEAQMNLARCYDADTTTIMKMLKKMLKDVKNTDFKDRIYYAMADVALENNNETDGVKYLRKSVASSTTNNMQKIKSSLDAADILFSNNEYILSQAYFDTAVMTMDRNYPGYDSLLNLSVMLTDLVSDLTVIHTQDSLLRLAAMDSIHRNAIIDQVIEEYKAEQERLQRQREIEEQIALNGGNEKPKDIVTDNDGNWYFYNNQTLSRGAGEFKKKWGNIMLEDFWFISNKQSFAVEEQQELTEDQLALLSDEERERYLMEQQMSKDTTQYTPLDRGYYLKQIPFSPSAQEQAHRQIMEALNNVGFTYYSELHDYPRSIEAYTELSNRYPDNPNEVSAWYYLYKMHSLRKETAEADNYKNLVLTKYPDSNQAKIILDPEYFIKEHEKGAEAEQLYAKTYEAFQNGQYQRVMMNVKRARQQYLEDTLYMPRFEFLNAISLGYVEVVDSMAYSLLRLIQTYPESSIKPFALDVLLKANDMYNLGLNIESARPKDEKVEEKESPYTFRPNDEYYVLVICNKKVRINPLKIRIGDFNKNNFRMNELKVKNIMLNKEDALITIEKFEDVNKAIDYQSAMFLTDYIFGGIDKENYKVLIISVSNYPIFYQEKNVDEYLDFWHQYNK